MADAHDALQQAHTAAARAGVPALQAEVDAAAALPAQVAARERDKWGFLPPGGESYRLLSERVETWFAGIKRPTMAVSHGGVGRVLRRTLLDLDPHEAVAMPFPQDQAMLIRDGAASWI